MMYLPYAGLPLTRKLCGAIPLSQVRRKLYPAGLGRRLSHSEMPLRTEQVSVPPVPGRAHDHAPGGGSVRDSDTKHRHQTPQVRGGAGGKLPLAYVYGQVSRVLRAAGQGDLSDYGHADDHWGGGPGRTSQGIYWGLPVDPLSRSQGNTTGATSNRREC